MCKILGVLLTLCRVLQWIDLEILRAGLAVTAWSSRYPAQPSSPWTFQAKPPSRSGLRLGEFTVKTLPQFPWWPEPLSVRLRLRLCLLNRHIPWRACWWPTPWLTCLARSLLPVSFWDKNLPSLGGERGEWREASTTATLRKIKLWRDLLGTWMWKIIGSAVEWLLDKNTILGLLN